MNKNVWDQQALFCALRNTTRSLQDKFSHLLWYLRGQFCRIPDNALSHSRPCDEEFASGNMQHDAISSNAQALFHSILFLEMRLSGFLARGNGPDIIGCGVRWGLCVMMQCSGPGMLHNKGVPTAALACDVQSDSWKLHQKCGDLLAPPESY
jgi:hypothetical protein